MRAPSTKTLLSALPQLTPNEAKLIRSIAGATADSEKLRRLIDTNVPGTARYALSLHGDPYPRQFWRNTIALHAMNEILGTHGVEGLGPLRPGDYAPPYEYLNAGDSYAATLIYDRKRDHLFVGSWGDLVEEHPEWESGEEHATIKRGASPSKSPAQLQRDIDRAIGVREGW